MPAVLTVKLSTEYGNDVSGLRNLKQQSRQYGWAGGLDGCLIRGRARSRRLRFELDGKRVRAVPGSAEHARVRHSTRRRTTTVS